MIGDDVTGAIGGAAVGIKVALASGGALAPAAAEAAADWAIGCSVYGGAKQVWNHFFGSN